MGTAESVVKMDNVLKEAAEPKQSEEGYTHSRSKIWVLVQEALLWAHESLWGVWNIFLGNHHPNGIGITSRDTCDFTTLMYCIRFPGTLIFSLETDIYLAELSLGGGGSVCP